jgi:hypothetical protein
VLFRSPSIEEVTDQPSRGSGIRGVAKKALKGSKRKGGVKALKDREMADVATASTDPTPVMVRPSQTNIRISRFRPSRVTKEVVVPHDKRPLAIEGPPAKRQDTRDVPVLRIPSRTALPIFKPKPTVSSTAIVPVMRMPSRTGARVSYRVRRSDKSREMYL